MPMVEQHVWRVVYDDQTELREYPTPSEHHSFDEVDIDRVEALIVEPNEWLGSFGQAFVLPMNGLHKMRPILFRTVQIEIDHNTGGQTQRRWHVFGYQETVKGTNRQTLMYLSNDDATLPLIIAREKLF
jgi:hypothetical protein